ncbi:VWA domain-containing protein [Microcoleus sp. Pol14C2]|uniref:VWA domain-containing protein n=1 Tax=unclassified Microcoleus TaxID=2642155 RepID=UPI002FD5E592
MQLLTDDMLLGSAVDVSAIAPLEEEIKGDPILSYGLDTRSASQLGASSSFISTFDGLRGQVGTIDPSAKFTQIASTFSFSDIAVSKDGTIFGITPTQLFKIDPVSGLTSYVGDLGAGVVNINALEFANDVLYAAGNSNLYTINTSNGAASFAANLGPGFTSSGDLVFDAANNRFLATSRGDTSDSLFAVSLTGQATKIGDIGINNVWGLLFEGGKLFGFTGDGKRIAIDPGTGAGVFDTLVQGISDRIGGASGIQIKKGEILSSTPGTILSADTIDVFLPPGGEITLDITVTVPGDASSSTTRSALSVESVDTVAAQMPSSSTVSASATTDQLPLDVFLLQDASSSFNDDLSTFRDLVPTLVDTLLSQQPDTRFGLGSFVDKPKLPFGNFADDDYVYRTNLSLTQDTTALQSTVNNLTTRRAGTTKPEAQLEALLQTALRSQGEIGFRDSARRAVVVATDAGFHQAGDGREAGITIPNNLDTILDGNPPGTGEDYPSIQQVREALIDAGIVPIFAVTPTSENISVYNDLVNQLGFGKVVRLDSDSANLVNAITEGLDKVSQEITLVPADDDFNYVKDISPKKFENVKPGDQLNFKVTLKSDSTGGDDNLKLQIPGFGNLGDTKVNVRTERVPTVVNNDTGGTSPAIGFIRNRTSLDITFRPPVIMGLFQDTNNDGTPDFTPNIPVKNIETYVVIHGNKDSFNKGKMADLAKTISEQDKQVIVLDWSVSADNLLPNISAGSIHDVAKFAADTLKNKWKIDSKNLNLIGHSLGSYVASEIGFILSNKEPDKELNPQYRQNPNIDPENRVNSLTALDPAALLGSNVLLSGLSSGLYDLENSINSTDVAGAQNPIKFSSVSKFSRAFWGDTFSGDGTGSSDYATSANESIYIDFKRPTENPRAGRDNLIPTDSHGNIVYLYRNLLKNPSEIGSLFKLGAGEHKEWKKDSYEGNEAILVATVYKDEREEGDEGKFDYKPFNGNDPNTEPKFLFIKDAQPQNDGIAYGSTGDDKLDGIISDTKIFLGLSQVNDAGNDKLYGDSGNDSIFSGSGNDTIFGGLGNDFINGEADNDLIEGGDDNDTIFGAKGDDTVKGGKGNDSLEGNDGQDTLIGGEDDDTLWGGGGNWADSLEGGDGNDYLLGEGGDDILIGGKGSDTIDCGDGNDTLVFGLDDGSTSRDGADMITNFRTGKLGSISTGDVRGVTKIKLNGLTKDDLEVVKIDDNKTLLWGKKNDLDLYTLFKQDTYFAILDGSFNKDQLTFI